MSKLLKCFKASLGILPKTVDTFTSILYFISLDSHPNQVQEVCTHSLLWASHPTDKGSWPNAHSRAGEWGSLCLLLPFPSLSYGMAERTGCLERKDGEGGGMWWAMNITGRCEGPCGPWVRLWALEPDYPDLNPGSVTICVTLASS